MASVAQAQKFGYVNSAAILSEMPKVKQADANLEALQKQLENKGKQMVDKYQQDVTVLQQRAERGELSPKQQDEEAQKLQARQNEIAAYRQESLAQLEEKRNNELKPIYDEINAAIKAVAQENGFTFIFEQGVLLYADESMDVSTMVKAKLGM